MSNTSTNLSSFRNEATLFYTDDYNEVVINEEQAQILQTFLEDESFTIKSRKEINPYLFRTPQNFVITSHAPEKKFVVELCSKDNAKNLISWIKSRDVGFYEIEYSYRFHNHQKQKKFNPDFFIKCERDGKIFYLVVEIKDDDDDSIENKAKYKYGKIHFEKLNSKLEELGKNECYIFHFLSPKSFPAFFKYFNNGRLFVSQENFRCDLENLLEIENE